MRIVVALGGNALLRRGRADDRRAPARERPGRGARAGAGRRAARARHLARQRPAGRAAGAAGGGLPGRSSAYPLDVLGAETEGMIGYLIEQELGNLLPFEKPFATHPDDGRGRPRRPGVRRPDQVRRPGLRRSRGRAARGREGLGRQAGRRRSWRRVVASPAAASGSSRSGRSAGCSSRAPSSSAPAAAASRRCTSPGPGTLVGVEAVIDKDLASALLARELDADLFVMATDVDGVYVDWGTPTTAPSGRRHPDGLPRPAVRGRLDGPQGRGRVRVRRRTGGERPRSARSAEIDGLVAGTAGHERRGGAEVHGQPETARRQMAMDRSASTPRSASSARSSSTGPSSASSG